MRSIQQVPLVYVHGWGFGPSVWDALRPLLPGQAIDLGYAGAPPAHTLPDRFVGIGHSFGALWLLHHHAPRLAGYVAINGFTRFATPPRVLARMRQRLAADPAAVLGEFRARCGAPPWAGPCDAARLAGDLDALGNWDKTATLAALAVPRLLLSAADDPLAPAAGHVSPTGGHLLPLRRPAWCADHIASLLRGP